MELRKLLCVTKKQGIFSAYSDENCVILLFFRNSLSVVMMQDLIEHINRDANNTELRVIVLSAIGSIFSAGHNLKELVCMFSTYD